MDYRREYRNRLRTPEEAVRLIEPGDHIVAPTAAGGPPALIDALATHSGLEGNRLYRLLPLHPLGNVDRERLQEVSLFLSGIDRPGFHEGRVDLLPNHFSELPMLLEQITGESRVMIAAVSPLDDQGYFSLGVSCDYAAPLLEGAKTILLEVNQHMPRTYGKNQIHISQANEKRFAIVEHHVPLPELRSPPITEKDRQIGRIVADLIGNGDALQIGFGAIPNAVMGFLKDHEDLSIYTEMLPENVVDLYEAGVITNRTNAVYPGKMTATFALGSAKLYTFMHENPAVYMIPVNESNHASSIAQLDNIVSINATVEVDLLGQCNSETIAGKYYSSTGGQADFAKGVRLAKHGRGIICLHSTAKNDSITKIMPALPGGAVVTTSKNDVDMVITEYGMAELKGKTIRERARALISIAHPNFREELEFGARKLRYL